MADLKLGKLPDRTASKITITVSAELSQTLKEYAALYRQTYGQSETVAELIPFHAGGVSGRRPSLCQGQKRTSADGACRKIVTPPLGQLEHCLAVATYLRSIGSNTLECRCAQERMWKEIPRKSLSLHFRFDAVVAYERSKRTQLVRRSTKRRAHCALLRPPPSASPFPL